MIEQLHSDASLDLGGAADSQDRNGDAPPPREDTDTNEKQERLQTFVQTAFASYPAARHRDIITAGLETAPVLQKSLLTAAEQVLSDSDWKAIGRERERRRREYRKGKYTEYLDDAWGSRHAWLPDRFRIPGPSSKPLNVHILNNLTTITKKALAGGITLPSLWAPGGVLSKACEKACGEPSNPPRLTRDAAQYALRDINIQISSLAEDDRAQLQTQPERESSLPNEKIRASSSSQSPSLPERDELEPIPERPRASSQKEGNHEHHSRSGPKLPRDRPPTPAASQSLSSASASSSPELGRRHANDLEPVVEDSIFPGPSTPDAHAQKLCGEIRSGLQGQLDMLKGREGSIFSLGSPSSVSAGYSETAERQELEDYEDAILQLQSESEYLADSTIRYVIKLLETVHGSPVAAALDPLWLELDDSDLPSKLPRAILQRPGKPTLIPLHHRQPTLHWTLLEMTISDTRFVDFRHFDSLRGLKIAETVQEKIQCWARRVLPGKFIRFKSVVSAPLALVKIDSNKV